MEDRERMTENACSFADVRPILMDLPYPPIQVSGKNQAYANLLSVDYCGRVSEMSAITQYINNENRMSGKQCALAKTILGIAMAEMIHLQKLGELIFLLGGKVDFVARQRDGRQRMWTPEYLTLPEEIEKMLSADIEAERNAIDQYAMHIKKIEDNQVCAILERIIKDEEYHIMLLKTLQKKV